MLCPLKRESAWIPFILTFLLLACWSELDLYAPSFPQMMHFYETTEAMMQLTLSLNFLGFFLASLLCGPLADSFGRRKVILGGSLLFVGGSAICVFAPSIWIMLLGRLVQGLGVSAPVTVCLAVVADIYQGKRQIALMTRMNSMITITMALAPIVGVYLTEHLGWQSNFLVIFAMALLGLFLIWFFLPETLEKAERRAFNKKNLVDGYKTLLISKDFMFRALACCCAVTPYFVFIGIMPLLFMEELGISLNRYSFYQGSVVGLFSLLSLTVPFVMARFDNKILVYLSTCLAISGLLLGLIISAIFPDNALMITACMLIYVTGIVQGPTFMFTTAMQLHPDLKASAASLQQALRMFSMSIGTAIAGAFYDGTFFPVAVILSVIIIVTLPLTIFVMRACQPAQPEVALAMH